MRQAVLAVLVVMCGALVFAAVALAAKPGNSVNAKACQQGGWQSLYTREGEPVASEQECKTYGAQGGQLINETALACLDGGWEALGPDETRMFTSEQECVDHAVGGGTLVTFADVRLGFEDSAAVMCVAPLNPAYCVSQDVRVYNDGSVPVTVTVSLSGSYDETPENSFANHLVNNNFCTNHTDDGASWSATCTVEDVPAGGSTFLARMWAYLGGSHEGSASVTESSAPDSDSSNDTLEWDFTAPVPT